MSEVALSRRQRNASLGAVIAATCGVGVFMGISMPLTSLVLERWGVAATVIGLVGAMPSLAMLLFGPFLAGIVRRIGARAAMFGGLALGGSALLLMPVMPTVWAWFVLRFLTGCGMALPWLVGETWINVVARNESRARVLGIYSAVLFLGMAVGPLVLRASDVEGYTPFLLAAAALVLAALPLLAAWHLMPPIESAPRLRLSQVIRVAPTIAGAALIAGLSESAFYFLLPVYGLRVGLGEDSALMLLTVLIAGAIALQYPIGWLGDRIDRRLLLAVMAVVAVVLTPAIALASVAAWAAWPALVVLGGVSLGFYGVGLALLGTRFALGDLAVANAAFMVLYEAGTFIGPGLAGTAMDIWNPHGYAAFLTLVAAGFALTVLRRRRGAP